MGRSLDERGPVDTYHRFGRTPDYTTSPYSLILHTAFLRTPDDISHHPLILITTLGEPLITLLHLIPCYFTPVCANPWLHFITLFVVTSHQFVWTPDCITPPYSLLLHTANPWLHFFTLFVVTSHQFVRTPDYTLSPYSLLLHNSLCEPLITLLHLIRCYFTPVCANPWLHYFTLFVDTWHLFGRTPDCTASPSSLILDTASRGDTYHRFERTPDETTSPGSLILDTALRAIRWHLTPVREIAVPQAGAFLFGHISLTNVFISLLFRWFRWFVFCSSLACRRRVYRWSPGVDKSERSFQ